MDYKKLINKNPLGSIQRLFSIFLYGNTEKSKYAFKCINKRLKKMDKDLRLQTGQKLRNIYSLNCYRGYIVECKHYFKDELLVLKTKTI